MTARAADGMRTSSRLAVWLFVLLAGCDITPHGEWNALECSNGRDDDGDQLVDCADPDCWAFACSEMRGVMDAGHDATISLPDAKIRDAQPVKDASPIHPDASIPADDDAGVLDPMEDDAGPPPTCTELPSLCEPGTVCRDDECVSDTWGPYTFLGVSAVVPVVSRSLVCFDDALLCGLLCDNDCKPDPVVVVRKYTGPSDAVGQAVYTTSPHGNDTERPSWSEPSPPVTVTLSPTDSLKFTVWDWDTPTLWSEIFSCKPDLAAQLDLGTLRCSPASSATSTPPDGVVFEIVVHVAKAE